jgi:hypothetical protein
MTLHPILLRRRAVQANDARPTRIFSLFFVYFRKVLGRLKLLWVDFACQHQSEGR